MDRRTYPLLASLVVVGCSGILDVDKYRFVDPDGGDVDAGASDGGPVADAGMDAGLDAGSDAGPADAGMDSGGDSGTDGGTDAGLDGGPSAGEPSVSALSASRVLATYTVQGGVSDPDGNLRSVTIDWGDGSAVEVVTTGFDNILKQHEYAVGGTFTIEVLAVEGDGPTAAIDSFSAAPVVFPGDAVFHEPFTSVDATTQCYLDTGSGLEVLKDRFGVAYEACFFFQNPGEEKFESYPPVSFATEATIAAWIRPASGSLAHLVGPSNLPALHYNDSRIEFRVDVGGTVHAVEEMVHDNQEWHFFVGVLSFDAPDSVIRLYKDAVLQAEERIPTWTQPTNDSCTFYIGGFDNPGCPSFISRSGYQGTFDDVRVYERALGEDEIQWLLMEGG